jgi:hypothetical protein
VIDKFNYLFQKNLTVCIVILFLVRKINNEHYFTFSSENLALIDIIMKSKQGIYKDCLKRSLIILFG